MHCVDIATILRYNNSNIAWRCFMNTFTVSFFGHRQIDRPLEAEERLEKIIRELIRNKEYVEFLVGRNGEFDQMAASTVRRVKKAVDDANSALVLVLPYMTAIAIPLFPAVQS